MPIEPWRPVPGTLLPPAQRPNFRGPTSIRPFMLCHKRGQLEKIRGIERAGQKWNGAFLGTMMHAARRQWWNDGFSGELWRESMKVAAGDMTDEAKINLHTEATRLFEAYRDHWAPGPHPEVLALEYPIPPDSGRPIGAVLDAVIRVDGAIYIDEMKNQNSWVQEMYRYWSMDWQIMVEQWCWGADQTTLFGGPLCGTVLDLVSTRATKTRVGDFDRERMPLVQPAWLTEAIWQAFTKFSTTGPASHTPRNPAACNQGKWSCPYWELCTQGEAAAGVYVKRVKNSPDFLPLLPADFE